MVSGTPTPHPPAPQVRGVVPRLLVPFVSLLSLHISATTLSGLETAVELWASLTQSLQTEWLQYSGLYGELLLEEVKANRKRDVRKVDASESRQQDQ